MRELHRNGSQRFPSDFMFHLTEEEANNLMFQNGISRWSGSRKVD